MKNLLTRLLLIALPFLMGILFLVFGFRNHLLGKESENWPSVKGRLVWETNTQAKKNKNVSISYEYQVNGVTYENARVNFRDDSASKKKIRDKYNVGDALDVHYQARDPKQSVLEPGASSMGLVTKIFSSLFCFLLTGVFLMMKKR